MECRNDGAHNVGNAAVHRGRTLLFVPEEADVAVFWPRMWGGGWLEFANGTRFQWKSINFWGTAWGFANTREELVFTMKPGAEKPKLSDLLKTQAVVEIETPSYGLAELPLLLVLGWYLMIMQQDDAATTAAVIS